MPISAFRASFLIKLQNRKFSTKIHCMDICPCLELIIDLIFSPMAVKRSVIGVHMQNSVLPA
jgi:hypothetical protein